MELSWKKCFTKIPGLNWKNNKVSFSTPINSLGRLKLFLDWVQIRYCLVRPFCKILEYPLVDSRELLPSFEADLYEFSSLPGFSMVAFDRKLDYFNEIFQFDILHTAAENIDNMHGRTCPLSKNIHAKNIQNIQARLPRMCQEKLRKSFSQLELTSLENYHQLLPYLLEMDRAHVMSLNAMSQFYMSGVYASFPSDLDTEIKRFGLSIKKFKINDNARYERNRNFVYQYLMELNGFPIVSERRTSASLFARRLHKMGEHFMVRVLGQSDRTITTFYSNHDNYFYPKLEKVALVKLEVQNKDIHSFLEEKGYFLDKEKKVIILRVHYKQHKFDANNIRQDRALSVLKQEIIHPLTGEVCSDFNIIKDIYSMTLKLNDIVRGEFTGRIRYKKNEIIENTETHEKRLKFLYSWLKKNQRRIIGYSDEFYSGVIKVLDSYLLNPDYFDDFNKFNDIFQEVWNTYSYIQQARKVKILEDIKNKEYKGEKIGYFEMLTLGNNLLNDLKFEIVNYFPAIVNQVIYISNSILNIKYIINTYILPKEDSLTEYGQTIRKLYGRLVSQVDEFKAIRKTRKSLAKYQEE